MRLRISFGGWREPFLVQLHCLLSSFRLRSIAGLWLCAKIPSISSENMGSGGGHASRQDRQECFRFKNHGTFNLSLWDQNQREIKSFIKKKLKTVTNQYLKIQCTWEGNKSKESGYFHLISPSTRWEVADWATWESICSEEGTLWSRDSFKLQ